ncbi:MAG: hypothetical protein PHE72_14710 [candidate division Zixibacteria bacterium]|nr:hypothetical protein [candidate division Zixibacteria bacterium]
MSLPTMPGDVGLNGLSSDTSSRILIDAGAIYTGFVDEDNPGICVGATRGGSRFTIEREIREIPVDGVMGPTKGLRRRNRDVATIEIYTMEMFPNNAQRFIAGADVDDSDPDYSIITGGPVEDADFLDNIAVVGTVHGNDLPFIGIITNALPESPMTIPLAPNDEAVIAAKWTGHFDPADPYTEPWELRIPADITGS